MKINLKYIASAVLVAASGAVLTSCDDWTEPESVDLNYGTIDKSENYPAYLESLRAYRGTAHKKVYAWVDVPAEGPQNQSHRLTALPDSIDVVVIETPEAIHPTLSADMQTVREEKGMEIIYCIDFDALKADYTLLCEELAAQRALIQPDENGETVIPDELQDPDFNDWMLEKLTAKLSLAKKVGFEGVMFAFNGRSTTHLQPAALAEYRQQQNLFMGVAADWHKRFPEFTYDFMGYPQFIEDREMLNDFRMIFIRQGLNATNADLFTYYLTMASEEGVPAEKLGMMTTYTSADPMDTTTGVFSDGTLAINSIGTWGAAHAVAGIGIQNVQNDYFNREFPYPAVRSAIQELNPSIK